jgi:ATP-dependent DNA ligase
MHHPALVRVGERVDDLSHLRQVRRGAGIALRFPRMLDGVRADKALEDATTEREIVDLAAM